MQPLRISVSVLAVGLAMAVASPAEAAWNNVFQVTCWGHRKPATSGYYTPPAAISYSSPGCCDPCPQPCTTRYVQRCYYQPVVTYRTQSYYEAVTTYKTSYYYEPCTSYRYSSYYDPCTCSYQQVATPVTSYKLRSQCCPVQSWVQRCTQVPVTSYQKSFYWEPQTTCCTTTIGAPIGLPPGAALPGGGAPPNVQGGQTGQPPQVDGQGSGGGNPDYNKYFKEQYRQLAPNGQPANPAQTTPTYQPPAVKLDKIALGEGNTVEGQVVSDQNAPRAGVQVTFVSVQKQSADKVVTSNAAGQFQVQLPAGGWLVYMRSADGQYVYHSRIDVAFQQKTPVILVSR
jgi:hypothetical protein